MHEVKYSKINNESDETLAIGINYFDEDICAVIFVQIKEKKIIAYFRPKVAEEKNLGLDEILNNAVDSTKESFPEFLPEAKGIKILREEFYKILAENNLLKEYQETLESKIPNDVINKL